MVLDQIFALYKLLLVVVVVVVLVVVVVGLVELCSTVTMGWD